MSVLSCLVSLCFPFIVGLSHDVRSCQCHGANHEPDWHDAAAVPLGRLPAVPGADAAGLPSGLLGHPEQDGGKRIIGQIMFLLNAKSPNNNVKSLCCIQTRANDYFSY